MSENYLSVLASEQFNQIEDLKTALSFYANKDNYTTVDGRLSRTLSSTILGDHKEEDISIDGDINKMRYAGETARKALAVLKGDV